MVGSVGGGEWLRVFGGQQANVSKVVEKANAAFACVRAQSCPTLRNPMDCILPGSCLHGIFQARVLEWGAIAFSEIMAQGILKKTGRQDHTTMNPTINKPFAKWTWRHKLFADQIIR